MNKGVCYMANLTNGPEMPMGLGMALAQDMSYMNKFASLSAEEKRRIIERTHSIRSKEEMQVFVESLFS